MLWRIFCNENAYHPCYRLNPYCVLNPYCMPFVNLNNLKIEMKVRLYIYCVSHNEGTAVQS